MTTQEQQRVAILEQVALGQVSGAEAAAPWGVTRRQLRRLRAVSWPISLSGLAPRP